MESVEGGVVAIAEPHSWITKKISNFVKNYISPQQDEFGEQSNQFNLFYYLQCVIASITLLDLLTECIKVLIIFSFASFFRIGNRFSLAHAIALLRTSSFYNDTEADKKKAKFAEYLALTFLLFSGFIFLFNLLAKAGAFQIDNSEQAEITFELVVSTVTFFLEMYIYCCHFEELKNNKRIRHKSIDLKSREESINQSENDPMLREPKQERSQYV